MEDYDSPATWLSERMARMATHERLRLPSAELAFLLDGASIAQWELENAASSTVVAVPAAQLQMPADGRIGEFCCLPIYYSPIPGVWIARRVR
jgi:hypothetical protein